MVYTSYRTNVLQLSIVQSVHMWHILKSTGAVGALSIFEVS